MSLEIYAEGSGFDAVTVNFAGQGTEQAQPFELSQWRWQKEVLLSSGTYTLSADVKFTPVGSDDAEEYSISWPVNVRVDTDEDDEEQVEPGCARFGFTGQDFHYYTNTFSRPPIGR